MPTTRPESVREILGEEAAIVFARWLDETFQQCAVERDEYREVRSRLDVLEERFVQVENRIDERFEKVDQRFERVGQRFEQVDERFDLIEKRMDERLNQIDQRFETMDTKFVRVNDRILSMTRWLICLIALFGSLVTALLAVAQFG